jgi:RNA polymerase sigma-70 factor (ECF subfamily)
MDTFADLDTLGIAAPALEPDRVLIEREDVQRLEAALERLPPRTREAIGLAYFEGLSATEIAKRMGVARPTASRFIAKGALILADIVYGTSVERRGKQ